jgi:hypothetical protein
MKRDEEHEPNAEYDQGHEEMAVGNSGLRLRGILHRYGVETCMAI